MCSFICRICRKEFHKFFSASQGSEDGIQCSGLQDLCTVSIASFSEETTVLQDLVFFPSLCKRWVGGGQVPSWFRQKERFSVAGC